MTAAVLGNIITDTTDWLADFSANWWFLVIIFAVSYFDSVIPIVPSETMVIIGGVAAGQGDQHVLAVIACGAVGAFLGDNTAYLIGARLSGFIDRLIEKRPKWRARLDAAADQIRYRGGLLLITARFIPGGRTALTVSSGITHQPRRWFVGWVAIAAVIWATYAALLGFLGGKAFEDNHTLAFLVAFVAAVSITLLIELVRHLRARYA
ncbi:MAG: DedA family protein [Ilumatobacter sp.]|uniref:DedA family protein n=1 Tax=Ilumatobacter sp. TaxID=1967498 RepID=UPI00260458ED|nr:DedA family protein [Ilumatobacter sp.]MDJ0770049.1 DedA family protein [Ilumatobacter sp.]